MTSLLKIVKVFSSVPLKVIYYAINFTYFWINCKKSKHDKKYVNKVFEIHMNLIFFLIYSTLDSMKLRRSDSLKFQTKVITIVYSHLHFSKQ